MPHLPPKYLTVHAAATKPSMDHVDADWIRQIHVGQNGWCYSTDTEVLTNNGWKDSETITDYDQVFTEEDGFVSDYQIHTSEDHDICHVKSGSFEAKFTENHKLSVYDNGLRDLPLSYLLGGESFDVKANVIVEHPSLDDISFELAVVIVNMGSFDNYENPTMIELVVNNEHLNYVESLLSGIDYELNEKPHHNFIAITDTTTVNKYHSLLCEGDTLSLPNYFLLLSETNKQSILTAFQKTKTVDDTELFGLMQGIAHTSGQILTNDGELLESHTHHVKSDDVTYSVEDIWSVDVNGRHILTRYNGCVQVTANSDVGYHYVIKRDGTLETGRPLSRVGAHVGRNNTGNIGICMAGGVTEHEVNISEDNFTDAQYSTLSKVLGSLHVDYPDATLMGHNDFDGYHSRGCPCFDQHEYFDWLHIAWKAKHRPVDWYDNSLYDWRTFDAMKWNYPHNFMHEIDTRKK